MATAGEYDAIVLAGGRSSRMGDVDKLGLEVGGATLLAHACGALADARRLVVVGPPGQVGVPAGTLRVREDPPFAGPAAAVGAGIAALGDEVAERVVVLAADVPRAREAVPALLAALDAHPASEGVVARSSDGHRQPLLAVYRTSALRAALAGHEPLVNGSVMRMIAELRLVELDLPDDVLADVDTPADLRRLTEEMPMNESALATWAADLAADLGIEQVLDVDTVLKLAADAAHGVMRPAAPLTTFLVGVAIGRTDGDPQRVTEMLERVRAAIAAWDEPKA